MGKATSSSLLHLSALLTCLCVILTPMFNDNQYFVILWIAYFIDIALALVVIIATNPKIRAVKENVIYLLFIAYSYISIFWAYYNKNESIRLLGLMFIFMIVSIEVISRAKCYMMVIKSFIIAGVATSLYVLLQKGISTFVSSLMSGSRFGGDVAQLNSLGALTATAATLSVALYVISKRKIYIFSFIINVLVMFGCESRMSLLMLVIGTVVTLYSLIVKQKSSGKRYKLFRFLLVLVILLSIGWYVLTQLPIFNGMYQRMFATIDFITGRRSSVEGSQIRPDLIKVGINEFINHPLFGIGYNNARYAARSYLGVELYLHNNYIEILANGGLVGFLLFYSVYASIIVKLRKKRDSNSSIVTIASILMLLLCIEGLFGVTYLSKYCYCILILLIAVANCNIKDLEDRSVSESLECIKPSSSHNCDSTLDSAFKNY